MGNSGNQTLPSNRACGHVRSQNISDRRSSAIRHPAGARELNDKFFQYSYNFSRIAGIQVAIATLCGNASYTGIAKFTGRVRVMKINYSLWRNFRFKRKPGDIFGILRRTVHYDGCIAAFQKKTVSTFFHFAEISRPVSKLEFYSRAVQYAQKRFRIGMQPYAAAGASVVVKNFHQITA